MRQLNLLNTNSRFLYEAYSDFTEKLLEHSPHPSLDTVIPVNSGSEALDLAIRLAQVATGRRDVVTVREGYHGWTMASDAVTTSAFDNPKALESRPDWVHVVENPNTYRGPHRGADAGEKYAADVKATFAKMAEAGHAPAAFLCEPVHGNGGGVYPPEGYLESVYDAVHAAGGLTIADEVQVGYARLGDGFWASEILGVVPD
ncbi:MAG TPA: aminotransferase class III-fold pyridoxal phosphate-dependent enzyme, partial [Microbacteriaceae bacterium]|nr:aminotransferase class III-fold pyridoxal phosphate-dependent enzyme [Microbacteriaceae bacterium]